MRGNRTNAAQRSTQLNRERARGSAPRTLLRGRQTRNEIGLNIVTKTITLNETVRETFLKVTNPTRIC